MFLSERRDRFGENPPLDFQWITRRLALGGAIGTEHNMRRLAALGITHVVDMMLEFDDSILCGGTAVQVLWNPCDDDLEPKPPELFRRGVEFALSAWSQPDARIYFHCAAGVHRGPMMLLAFLGALGMELEQGVEMIRNKRLVAEFPTVYLKSVAAFLQELGQELGQEFGVRSAECGGPDEE